jgi:hypothetical protein
VRSIAVHAGTDQLRPLADELRHRAAVAARHGAPGLAELRALDPAGRWPRLVVMVDEFAALAADAGGTLADLARRGHALGIHLVLAGRDAAALGGIGEHFRLRIALPKARGVLAGTNLAADVIPRFHAVVNVEAGGPAGNRVLRIPDAGDRDAWRRLRRRLWTARPEGLPPPRFADARCGSPTASGE